MQQLRQWKASLDAKPDHQRVKSLALVEIKVLRCVNQIKPRDPTNDTGGENERSKTYRSGLCNPRANRRDRKRSAEKKMGRGSETLGQRIEKDCCERDR